MVQSKAKTVDEYIASLPPDRRDGIAAVRRVILKNLPKGYAEVMDFGMIAYVVPLKRAPETYNGHPLMYAALASQRQYMAVYLMGLYGNPKTERWFREEYAKLGRKPDMGKCCVRFKKLEHLPLGLVGKVVSLVPVEKLIGHYAASRKKKRVRRSDAREPGGSSGR